jgi:hypothetical protein
MDNDDAQRTVDLLKGYLACTYDKVKQGKLDARDVWCANHENLVVVANVLEDAGYFGDRADVLYFFEKPWKYEGDMRHLVKRPALLQQQGVL